MEVFHKTYVEDENGNMQRINESKKYIIDALKVSSKADILYSEMKILKDMLFVYKQTGTLDDYEIPDRQFYTTIGSGYSDINLNTFNKSIPNSGILLENNDQYTDALRHQQYLIDTHPEFDLNNIHKIREYLNSFKTSSYKPNNLEVPYNDIANKLQNRISEIKKQILSETNSSFQFQDKNQTKRHTFGKN
jgi:hypothetical protein